MTELKLLWLPSPTRDSVIIDPTYDPVQPEHSPYQRRQYAQPQVVYNFY